MCVLLWQTLLLFGVCVCVSLCLRVELGCVSLSVVCAAVAIIVVVGVFVVVVVFDVMFRIGGSMQRNWIAAISGSALTLLGLSTSSTLSMTVHIMNESYWYL